MRGKIACAVALLAAGGAVSASPVYSTVNPSPDATRAGFANSNHDGILGKIYGGMFTPVSTVSAPNTVNYLTNSGVQPAGGKGATTVLAYTNNNAVAPITATRIADRGGPGLFQLLTGGPNDQRWSDGVVQVIVEAKFAGDNSTFGWINDNPSAGPATGVFNSIVNTSAVGTSVTLNLTNAFRWALLDHTTKNLLSSVEADNDFVLGVGGKGDPRRSGSEGDWLGRTVSDLDQMVAYEVTGLNDGFKRYLLAFEDRVQGERFEDYDYNDAVLELRVVLIPTPQAAMMGLAGLGMVAGASRRRR